MDVSDMVQDILLEDGFVKCTAPNCGLEVVRPGKAQCWCDDGSTEPPQHHEPSTNTVGSCNRSFHEAPTTRKEPSTMSDTTQVVESARKRAWRGLKAIIKHGPELGINLANLNVQTIANGHGFQQYTAIVNKLGTLNLDPGDYANWRIRYGFDGTTHGDASYIQDRQDLLAAWQDLLTSVRAVAGTNPVQAHENGTIGFQVNGATAAAVRQAYVNSVQLIDRRTQPELYLLTQTVNLVPAQDLEAAIQVLLTNFKAQLARQAN